MRWRRWIVPVLVLAAVVAAVVWGMRPQPVLVETATVTKGLLRVTVEEEGKTRLKDRYVIQAPITGRMERINLDEGDPVRQGQALTRVRPLLPEFLDPRGRAQLEAELAAVQARLRSAEERVRAARASEDLANSELNRMRKLIGTGDVARSRLEQAETEQRRAVAAVAEAESAVAAAREEVNRARVALQQPGRDASDSTVAVTVVAPARGRVLRVIRDSEGPVAIGEQLLEIGDARALEVEIEVLSPDAVQIRPGTRVLFTRWGGDSTLEGTVQRVEPAGRTKISALGVEEQRVPVIAILTSPEEQWRGLGAGYRVEAAFVLWEGADVVQVPGSAAFRDGNGWAVFVVENNVARKRAVKLGRRSGLYAEVLDGVTPGTVVLAHPDTSIEQGTFVQPRRQEKE